MPDAAVPELSIVIPLRDEEHNVGLLHAELTRVLTTLGRPYEIIFIEDGSRDGTFEAVAALHRQDAHVRVIRFTRNFGQTAAFAAGFAAARGALVVTCDGDLQNDPADIPRMVALAATHDIVCGWRRQRKDAFLTRHVPSVVANTLIGWVSGVPLHDNGCSLKVFRAEVVKPLRLRPGMHRYLPALASQFGDRIVEVEVHHRPRRFGHSKYGLSRTFTVVADLMHLRRLIREAGQPGPPDRPQYEVAETLG